MDINESLNRLPKLFPFLAKNNIIHDLPDNFGYNGIMVDDGTGNARLQGNLIYSVADKCIYNWYNSAKRNSNHNNLLISNILLGDISYGGFDPEDPNNSLYQGNIFLSYKVKDYLMKSYSTDGGGNVFVDKYNIRKKIKLSKSVVKIIRADELYSKRINQSIKRY